MADGKVIAELEVKWVDCDLPKAIEKVISNRVTVSGDTSVLDQVVSVYFASKGKIT